MTLILGTKCRDGIVIGADSMFTVGPDVGNVQLDDIKVHTLGDCGVVAFAGDLSVSQVVLDDLKDKWSSLLEVKSKSDVRRIVSRSIREAIGKEFASGQRTVFSAIVALPIQNQPVLMLFKEDPPPLEARGRIYFLTSGSGQQFAFLFLKFLERIFWNNNAPSSISDGILGTMWTIQHIIDSNAKMGIGGSPHIAVIEDRQNTGIWKSRILQEVESGEYREQIFAIETIMRLVKENWSRQ